MATVCEVTRTCDVCGDGEGAKTWTFVLDGKAYEIDLCGEDGSAFERVMARYIAKARKVTAQRDRRRHGSSRAAGQRRQDTRKGICVYGILPADIEVAAGVPGVGKHPGPLRDVRLDGLAALISEVDLSGPLGSPDDLRTYRAILDATAAEIPILPLRFGTILPSEDAVAEELLAASHDEFAAALGRLEGRAEFLVEARYVADAAGREEDTRALQQAMEGVCVASVVRELADEPDSVHVAFLVDIDQEREAERIVDDLAREWEGRIEVRLLGPMAAYDFTGTAQPES